MNSDHVVALALLIAELRMQISQLAAENEQLRVLVARTEEASVEP